jgi:hypothetical protein
MPKTFPVETRLASIVPAAPPRRSEASAANIDVLATESASVDRSRTRRGPEQRLSKIRADRERLLNFWLVFHEDDLFPNRHRLVVRGYDRGSFSRRRARIGAAMKAVGSRASPPEFDLPRRQAPPRDTLQIGIARCFTATSSSPPLC